MCISAGELYSWGANAHGQLGIGTVSEMSNSPALITSLAGMPIAFITCGGNHSFAVSKYVTYCRMLDTTGLLLLRLYLRN